MELIQSGRVTGKSLYIHVDHEKLVLQTQLDWAGTLENTSVYFNTNGKSFSSFFYPNKYVLFNFLFHNLKKTLQYQGKVFSQRQKDNINKTFLVYNFCSQFSKNLMRTLYGNHFNSRMLCLCQYWLSWISELHRITNQGCGFQLFKEQLIVSLPLFQNQLLVLYILMLEPSKHRVPTPNSSLNFFFL